VDGVGRCLHQRHREILVYPAFNHVEILVNDELADDAVSVDRCVKNSEGELLAGDFPRCIALGGVVTIERIEAEFCIKRQVLQGDVSDV
jgi:hypothetical protein